VSRVARKREQARRRLIAAASGLIAERGVDGLRLREIADRADIGFGSFYNHFASKEELVAAVAAESIGAAIAAIVASAADDGDPAVTAAAAHRAFIRLAYDDPQLARLMVNIDHADAVLETASLPYLSSVLARGVQTGRFRGVEVDVAATFIVGATITVMRGILDGRLGADADAASARTLLRACGLEDAEAAEIAARPLPRGRRP
jgi:AcrR family transcriptional regulator